MKTVLFLSDYENRSEFEAVFKHLQPHGILGLLAKPCDISISARVTSTDIIFEQKIIRPDLVVGYAFEDDLLPAFKLMEMFKALNIPVLNDGPTLLNGQNKEVSSVILNQDPNVRHLPYITLNNDQFIEFISEIGFPAVVKPMNSSGGKGLMKFDDLPSLLEWTSANKEARMNYYAQPYIEKMENKDFRVVVVNGKACYSYQRAGYNNSWITNLCSQGTGIVFEVNELESAMVKMAEAAATVAKAPFCGVDIAFDTKGDPFIIEINTCPAIEISKYIPSASDKVERAFAEFIIESLQK